MKKCARCRNQEAFEELLVCRKYKSAFHDDSDLISGFNPMKLDVVDPESFEAIDYKTFEDRSGVYQIEHSKVRRMEADEIPSCIASCVQRTNVHLENSI
tara:strand:- start:148 stop:444 length:297 start_codon:yes stop_codon:yes gene_type:complete